MSTTRKSRVTRAALGTALILASMATAMTPADAAPKKPKPVDVSSLPADAAISNNGQVRLAQANSEAAATGFSGFEGNAPQPESAESIIGTDQRVQVTGTTTYPARAVGLITRNGAHHCTGWLISRDTVLTAGHCVHAGAGGAFFTGLRFFPGRNGATSPYGSCVPRSGGLTTFVGWSRDGSEAHDAGIIKLSCTIGDTTGWFGFWWQSASLNGVSTQIQGYPGDKPQTQWRSNDFVRATETFQVFYNNDTLGGMSGSPVWQNRPAGSSFCSGACGMAIHAYGTHGSGNHPLHNHGTRNTQAKSDLYLSIRSAP